MTHHTFRELHPWDVPPAEGRAIQERLQERLVLEDDFGELRTVAGVDVGFEDKGQTARAAVAVLSFPRLEPLAHAIARQPTRMPYIPGLLSFREIPVVLEALQQLDTLPDIILCDGQGIAHPRRMGIACHLGLITGLPTIGVGKTRLVGEHDPVPDQKGAHVSLVHQGETVGAVLRTRQGVKPIFVSPGHRVSLESSIRIVMDCVTRYKLPETTRAAHHLASG